MVSGTINGAPFKALLEPDGRYAPGQNPSHWFRPDKKLLDDASAKAGDTVHVSLEPTTEWIEPEVPEDVKKAGSCRFRGVDHHGIAFAAPRPVIGLRMEVRHDAVSAQHSA